MLILITKELDNDATKYLTEANKFSRDLVSVDSGIATFRRILRTTILRNVYIC